jgi:large subunit ribosomal protein L24
MTNEGIHCSEVSCNQFVIRHSDFVITAMLIRTGDNVEVIAGADRGKQSRVIQIDRQSDRVLVEGVARVYKHVPRSQKHPQGGRLSKESPVDASNIAFICPACSKATRLGARFTSTGAKERYCKKCGAAAGEIAPAKQAHAKK